MNGRRATVGLSLLCALVFCAFAAPSASAIPAKNTTAFTCIQGGGFKDFQDQHCDQRVGPELGQFGHVPIPLNQTTEITVSNEKTSIGTFESTPTVLKFILGAKPVEISCKTVHGVGTMHNMEPLPQEHKVTGTLTVKATECKVLKPMKCFVKEPIEYKTEFEGVEGLGPEANTHGIEFKPHVEEGGTLMTITLEGPECAFKGVIVPITGTMIATGGPNPKEQHSGATQIFTNEMTKETLKAGGKPAEHSGALTLRMAPVRGQEQPPISFTTVT